MLNLPESYDDVEKYTDDLLEFINTPLVRQITGGIHVNDALIHNAWEALPPEWTAWWNSLPDHRLAQQDLIDSIEEPTNTVSTTGEHSDGGLSQLLQGRPASLTKWLKTLQSLSLPRAQRPGLSVTLPDVLTSRMNTKKKAEVSTAVAYIRSVCEANNITHVIDMGSGQGYLSVSLAFLFPDLRVLAIDGSESQLAASSAAAAGLGIPEGRIRHLRRYVDGTPPLAAEMAAWAGGNRCMLVGLHACGNLSEHMLKYFTTASFITHLGAIGCCYNHIVPRSASCPDGFPISAKMRDGGLVLSATALMTGCQAPNNWDRADLTKEESVYSKRRFYRALLEKVFFDKGIRLDTESRPVWGARKGDTASFVQFARRAVGVLGVDGSGIPDGELALYESRYRDYSSRIAILWMLSVLCCKAAESVIALDRWWFLVENGGHNVDVLPVFDYTISPRNLMIVASRDIT
ncbi:Putative Methyltransferase domain-containing protein [Colletotrichum destructivum]|uniref:Methyltransferase domain-containing protein n=1 Tax=Colletotrichum destructivum TaxID=34406 RepID=A0AAX4J0V7_9PEZI|nr:Putative Methyltransferase domain-containing protein [Colletotrichum destructivum]